MSTKLLLTEGGIAGHMSHLYDNRELTFRKLKKIFSAASNGKLQGTEKTDGQNLFVSYSAKRGLRGAAKGSRNKSHIKSGGLDSRELYDFFEAAHPGKDLSNAFSEALATFERAVKALNLETQIAIFGEDNNIYYNAEVMDSRTPNVVKYDTKSLVIHRAGHGEFDKETGKKTDRNISANAKALDAALPAMQQATYKEDYTVHVNAIRTLEALEDDTALNVALDALTSLQGSVGVSDNSTITEFMIARVAPLVASALEDGLPDLDVDREIQKMVISWMLDGGVNLNQIKDNFDKEDKSRVSELLKNGKKGILQKAIAPLENIVHDFSVEMIRGLESAFILDNRGEVDRLQKELRAAKEEIESGRRGPEAIEILMRQMEKLKKIENFATASEGFVFEFEGVTYKFTGNFAPANQIIGIAKYGRGRDVPQDTQDATVMKEDEEGKNTRADVAVVPGAFKPPHRGHLTMIAEYSRFADRVVVFMSPVSRGDDITFDKAYKLWQMYLTSVGLSNVKVMESPVNSPVGAAFNFIANEDNNPDWAQPGETVILGVSTKGGDESRFGKDAQKYAGEDITVLSGAGYAIDPSGPNFTSAITGEPLSASDMREAIANEDLETFTEYLPTTLKNDAEDILNDIFYSDDYPSENVSEMIFRMINEMSAGGAGAVAGAPMAFGPSKRSKKKKKKKDIKKRDDNYYNEVNRITELVIEKFKGMSKNGH